MSNPLFWPSIEAWYNVKRNVSKYDVMPNVSAVDYKGKIKLHGTNAAVVIESTGAVRALSRASVLSRESDNYGFAAYVADHLAESYSQLSQTNKTIYVYGEWCGKGVQKGVALSQLQSRVFAIFACVVVDNVTEAKTFICEPNELQRFSLTEHSAYVLPWMHSCTLNVRTDNVDEIDKINKLVEEVEQVDPWVKSTFDISGTGEGLVMYPFVDGRCTFELFQNFAFKAKGEKHKVVEKEKPVQDNVPSADSVAAYVKLVLTDARYEQGVRATNDGEFKHDMRKVGDFIAWMKADLAKETSNILEASGIQNVKFAYDACAKAARERYIAEAKKVTS